LFILLYSGLSGLPWISSTIVCFFKELRVAGYIMSLIFHRLHKRFITLKDLSSLTGDSLWHLVACHGIGQFRKHVGDPVCEEKNQDEESFGAERTIKEPISS
jgi:predicted aminopeptidase